MTFEQLQFFLAIVANKTFTAAAEELFISQSSLSKSIKALENELGCSLFSRGSKFVELTTSGQLFYNYAKCTEQNRINMLNELSVLNQNIKMTEISLGVIPVLDELNMHNYITDFQTRFLSSQSSAYINIVEGEQDNLVKHLTEEKIDAAIVRSDELSPDIFNIVNIQQNELVLIYSSFEDELCGMKKTDFSDLTGYPFIEFDKSSLLSRKIRNVFASKGLMPRYSYSFKRHQQILAMVNAGCGIAIIPRDLVDTEKNPNIQIAYFTEPIYTQTSLVWLKNIPQNEVVLLLASFLSDNLPDG